jgi:hypothetical protein
MRSPARDGMVHARLHTPQLCWLFAVHKREEGGTPYVTCCDKQELVACVVQLRGGVAGIRAPGAPQGRCRSMKRTP